MNEDGTGAPAGNEEQLWLQEKGLDNEDEDAIFKGIEKEGDDIGGFTGMGAENLEPWSLKDEEEDKGDVFKSQEDDDMKGLEEEFGVVEESVRSEEVDKLEKEEKELTAILKGYA